MKPEIVYNVSRLALSISDCHRGVEGDCLGGVENDCHAMEGSKVTDVELSYK